jgi:N-formylmaleamate deformylase
MTKIARNGRHVVVNGLRLHYVSFCSGKHPLLLLPGITAPAATWEFVAEKLADYYDVYIMNVRGRGLSERSSNSGYRLDDYASDAERFITRLQLDRPHVVGHSMGARIGIRLAATYQNLLSKLVIVDPPVSGPARRPYPIPLQFYLDSLGEVERGEGYEQMRRAFDWTDDQLEARMEWLPTCDRNAIIESHRSFQEEDIHQNMPSISAETLLIYAEKGDTVRKEEADEIQRLIPRCQSLRMDNAGHMIPWDKLDAFVTSVRSFLR